MPIDHRPIPNSVSEEDQAESEYWDQVFLWESEVVELERLQAVEREASNVQQRPP